MIVFPFILSGLLAAAQTPSNRLEARLSAHAISGVFRSALGVTRQGTRIPYLFTTADLDYNTRRTRVLLVGGLDGSDASVDSVLEAFDWFHTSPAARRFRTSFALSAVPVANPDGWLKGGPANGSGGDPTRGYPPQGDAYNSATDPEAAYLWRWIGMQAADLVVEVRKGKDYGFALPDDEGLRELARLLTPGRTLPPSDELVPQLVRAAPSGTGTVPAVRVELSKKTSFLDALLSALRQAKFTGPSPARREIQRRLARTPLETARQLADHYGHELEDAVYIPAMAVIGRLRLADLTGDATVLQDVERIVEPYASGTKPALPPQVSGSHLSGHLLFGELARRTARSRYLELARAAADLGFDQQGRPLESMPFHSEMSDAVFMGCPILALLGRLTGEARYFEQCIRHLRFMLGLDLRRDGLWRHSPLDPAAWGRGNGFPALGLALSLSEIPGDNPGRAEMLRIFRSHLNALLAHQDPTGAWHQVIDASESYRELTATCMIGLAMLRGIRLGWLERARFEPAVERAWHAVQTRVAPDGTLVDVCTGTGKQRSLRDYLDRPAILGRDPRGGAMALLFAVEMAEWQVQRKKR
jgi:unsaturated rhamnogalacturonyl hydrolase